MNSWGTSWRGAWGYSWGLTWEANQEDEVEWLGGGGDVHVRTEEKKYSARDLDYLDPEYWKRLEIPKEVEKTAAKVAKKVVQKALKAAQTGEPERYLADVLRHQEIAWDAFYADLLRQQIDAQITAEIQARLIEQGIIEQSLIAEANDEELALMTLLFEL